MMMKRKRRKTKPKLKCHLSNRLYIPVKRGFASQLNTIAEMFTHEIVPYNSPCKKCTTPDMCDECVNQPRIVETFSTDDHEGKWLSVPRGDLRKVKAVLKTLNAVVEDHRSFRKHPLLKDVTWNKKYPLFKYQKKAVRDWLRNGGYGILQAKARSGKTVMTAALLVQLKAPMLFLAHRDRLLKQFIKTCYKFTNIKELERFHSRPFIGYVSDYRKYPASKHPPILVSSTQLFADNYKLMKRYQNFAGITVLDECHHVAAETFSKVYDNFNPRYRLGLTATPGRKDGYDPVMFDIVGPVKVVAKSKALPCVVDIINTGHVIEDFKMWPTFLRRLAHDDKRNRFIVDHAVKDIKKGRYLLIVTSRVDHAIKLTSMINKRLGKGDKPVAVAWYSATDKAYGDEIAAKCESGEYKVAVSTRDFVQEGIDCPLWDTYYCITPSANPFSYYQEVSRIRTPLPGKKPIVRYFLDDGSAAFSCLRVASSVHDEEKFRTLKSKGSGYEYYSSNKKKPLSQMFSSV